MSGRLSRHVHRAASAERGAAWCRRKSRAPRAPHVLPACSPRLCCKPAAPPPCACAGCHQPRGGHGCSLPAPVSGRHSLLETLRGVRAVPGALPSSRRSAIPVGNAGDLNSAADFTSTPHLLFRGSDSEVTGQRERDKTVGGYGTSSHAGGRGGETSRGQNRGCRCLWGGDGETQRRLHEGLRGRCDREVRGPARGVALSGLACGLLGETARVFGTRHPSPSQMSHACDTAI